MRSKFKAGDILEYIGRTSLEKEFIVIKQINPDTYYDVLVIQAQKNYTASIPKLILEGQYEKVNSKQFDFVNLLYSL